MIDILFRLAGEHLLVRIDFNSIYLGATTQGAYIAPLDEKHIKLSRVGVIKEFPDLKDNPFWEKEAIERFKKHFRELKDEDAKVKYVIEDLRKHGYIPVYKQVAGCRPERLK